MRKKTLFIANKAAWYRLPFFKEMFDKFGVKFIFTRQESLDNADLGFDYKSFVPKGPEFFKVSFSLIPSLLREDYDLVVFPPIDSPGELIDNLLCYLIAKLRKKDFLIWSEAWSNKSFNSIYKKIKFSSLGFISKRASRCIASGSKATHLFLRFGVDPSKIYVSPSVSVMNATNEDSY